MKRIALIFLVSAALACATAPAAAADLQVGASDTVETLLKGQQGKRVTVRVRSGQEFTGMVRTVTARVVQLGAITGREFFDAVVQLDAIEALIVRTKD